MLLRYIVYIVIISFAPFKSIKNYYLLAENTTITSTILLGDIESESDQEKELELEKITEKDVDDKILSPQVKIKSDDRTINHLVINAYSLQNQNFKIPGTPPPDII